MTMYRPDIDGKGQALSGDRTTTGALLISYISHFAICDGRGFILQGDKTGVCPKCGKAGTVAEGDPDYTWEGIPISVDRNIVSCGCPYGTNRIIAPLGPLSSSKPAGLMKAADHSSQSQATPPSSQAKPSQSLAAGEKPKANDKGPLTPELIAVAVSQHNSRSGNKMMFIGQAVRELGEFKRYKPALARTLLLFTPSYNDAMLSAARSSAEGYGAKVVIITNARELIDYLNSGKDRTQSPIEQLSFFSHGVPQRIAFGYHISGDYQMSLDVLNYSKISPQAFSPTARIDSYACRTGMGNRPDYPIEEGIQFFPQTNESLAQLLANHLRIKVHAFIRRSDYKNTWGTLEERQLGKLCQISNDSAPGYEWCKRWKKLSDERKETDRSLDFTYQSIGATNPVISGDTPIGTPGGHFEFSPK